MRILSGPSKVDEVIITSTASGGFVGKDSDGDLCFIPERAVTQHGLKVGDVMTGALVQYKREGAFQWFAEWVLPWRMVTLDEVVAALEDLQEGGAIRAADVGVHVGDILYHAGLAQKIVGFNRKETVDPSNHVLYTIELDNVMNEIAEEFEEDEG